MGLRRNARELALKLLYRIDLTGEERETVLDSLPEYSGSETVHKFGGSLIDTVLAYQKEFDTILSEAARNWKLPRMATLDRNILRIALAEHLVLGSAPPAVIIDEAVEIAEKYSTAESGPFVNGILDPILREREARSLSDATKNPDAPSNTHS